MKKFLIALILVLIVSATMLAGCTVPGPDGNGNGGTVTGPDNLERFESYDALVAAFEEAKEGDYYGGFLGRGINVLEAIPMAADAGAAPKGETQAADYSATNIQVEGVDEADIVKTDGKYIYTFSSNALVITDAYPLDTSQVLSSTDLNDLYPSEMFINGDRLILFGTKTNYEDYGYKCFGCWYGGSFAAQVYDITDRARPELEKEVEADGHYLTSRMIGDDVYFVVNSYPYWESYPVPLRETEALPIGGTEKTKEGASDGSEDTNSIIPVMREDGVEMPIAEATEIGIVPGVMPESFLTIYSIDMDSLKMQKEVIAASGEEVYASQESLYIAESVWNYYESDLNGNILEEAIEPVVKAIAPIFYSYSENTLVSKFRLDEGKVSYVASGAAPGRILNQFSMDEYRNNFRIATTVSGTWGPEGRESANNIYVFDSDMEMVGALEDLAPGEQIYSARFMGKKGYLVTFRNIDPLFVIDLEDPENPTVLGKLKIPGYSDYLHPIDEDHLIGLGKDTIDSKSIDFVWYQGIKMAIFDVSDVENPVEMHKTIIGDRGTESYALHDHKAFLFDREKGILVIPITLAEIPQETKDSIPESEEDMWWPHYGEYTFQGAFVFDVSLEEGIVERGRVTHVTEEDELKRGYYFGSEYSVKRSLYIDDILYTISENTIKANDLESLEELKSFSMK